MAKVLILDIETSPSLAHVWQYWEANISPKQVKETSHIMSIAYKWLGADTVYYEENRKGNDKKVVKAMIKALDEADVVIAHNAKKFDLPVVNARALVAGLSPPAPYKVVDTLLVARKVFRFGNNSLEFLANYLGCTPKEGHKKFPGFELWRECLAGNDEAWEEMREYNVQDVLTLEEVYLKLRPWMPQHPNMGIYSEKEVPVCPKCGSEHINYRGYVLSTVAKYHRFQCRDCGGWGRLRTNQLTKEVRQSLATNVAD